MREDARDKIAKSVGFTLDNSKNTVPDTESRLMPGINSDEYDIKILSINGKGGQPPENRAHKKEGKPEDFD